MSAAHQLKHYPAARVIVAGPAKVIDAEQVGFRIIVFETFSAFTHVYGPHHRQVTTRPSTPKASAASLPPRLLRLLPAGGKVAGRDSHPLKDCAFARRTLPLHYSALTN